MIGTKLFRNYFAHDEYKTDYLDLNVSYTKLLSVVKLRLSKVRALETSVADPALANAPPPQGRAPHARVSRCGRRRGKWGVGKFFDFEYQIVEF